MKEKTKQKTFIYVEKKKNYNFSSWIFFKVSLQQHQTTAPTTSSRNFGI